MYKFIAHRGLINNKFKENTKETIINSLKKPYIKGVEFDVRKTKDNKLVLIHDGIINLESNGSGIVKYMTVKQLKKYNFGTKKTKIKINTLDEVLKKIKSDKLIIIEAKVDNIEEDLYNIIKKYKYLNIYICSFYYNFLINFKKKYPNYKVGLIISNIINKNRDVTKFDFVLVHYNVEKKYTKETMVWTVNDKKNLVKTNKEYYIVTNNAEKLYMSSMNRSSIL